MIRFRIQPLLHYKFLYLLCALFFILAGEGLNNPLSANNRVFYDEIRVHGSKIDARLSKWKHNVERHSQILENSNHPNILKWREQVTALDFSDELKVLTLLNSYINSDIRYVDDYHHFHKEDYWADPVVALTEGGDCEDIALTKTATLHRLGWPENRRHLLIGYLMERGKESHAVLLVETADGEQYIMRSITNEVVKPSKFQFIPVYAVDGYGTLIVKPHRYPRPQSMPRQE